LIQKGREGGTTDGWLREDPRKDWFIEEIVLQDAGYFIEDEAEGEELARLWYEVTKTP